MVEAASGCLIPSGFAIILLGNPVVFNELLEVAWHGKCFLNWNRSKLLIKLFNQELIKLDKKEK